MPVPDRWLLLRGLGRETGHWHEFPQQLVACLGLADDSVHLLDLPGCGDQSAAPVPLRVAGIAATVRHRWLEHARDGRWGLLGISLGAMVALDWAARRPDDFIRVVAISPSERTTSWWLQRLRWRSLPLVLRIATSRSLQRREGLLLQLTTVGLGQRRARLLDERAKMAGRNPVRAPAVLRQLLAAARWRMPTPAPVPTLVLAGLGDRLVDPQCSQRLAARLGTAAVHHPWAGHDLPLDDPRWVCEQLTAWLSADPSGTRASAESGRIRKRIRWDVDAGGKP